MFRTETHLHTAECSACTSASGSEQAQHYKELGYDTIIVTDHFLNGNTTIDRSLPWSEKMELFCLGFENAKAKGEELGLNVLFGLEYSWNGSDFLAYGIDKQWLKENDDLMDISVYEFCNRVHFAGGIIVHAHPFRRMSYLRDIKLIPDFCDGVEVYNGGNHAKEDDERALWYAKEFNLIQTAGSDCHHLNSDKFYSVVTDFEIKSIEQYCDAVRNNAIKKLEHK
ncbi:MAG: histidinol-phosphatase [Ruminococcus sp.]|nr:histidinol-phosphatase [Ruminococcus sp.]